MICPECGSRMVEIIRKVAYQCLYSGCPRYKHTYYPFETVAVYDGKKVIRCPNCRGLAEVTGEEAGIIGFDCPRCGELGWPNWVDDES